MASQEFAPFKPGTTLFGGSPTTSTAEDGLLGEEFEFRDTTYGTGRMRRYRVVRNSAGIALDSKRLAKLNAAGNAIVGYANAPSDVGFPIDDALGTVTVATNDICYIGVSGPHACLTDLANYSADLAAGDYLTPQTAATSQATTAGRIVLQAITSSVTAAQTTARGVFARAISAAVTNATNTAVLVDVLSGRDS